MHTQKSCFVLSFQSPPPAAIEFLSKIREVITLAKYKMATKRFQPSLTMIPEEHLNAYINATNGSKPLVQQNMNKSDKKSCAGCTGCVNDKAGVNCKNCGEKRNSIRKWLEGVSKHENGILTEQDETGQTTDKNESIISTIEVNSSPSSNAKLNDSGGSSSESDTVKANSLGSKSSKKRKAPPIPSTAPKIISHFLKKDNQSVKPQPERPAPMLNSNVNTEMDNHTPNSGSNVIVKNTNMNTVANTSPLQLKTGNLIEKSDIYNSLSLLGSEIYNNPQFMLSSPSLSHRSKSGRNSSQSRQSSSKKRIDVLDQYANPAQLIQENMVKNLQNVPDMVYEAISKDFPPQRNANASNQVYGHLNVPTPDYDDPSSTYSRKRFNSYENDETLIPPPDYNSNTLGRKQYQPDSPIYHRKSPHYLIVDYETDSLERTNTNKMIRNSFTPHSNNSSDLSSQPSPSLSSALPLEEEVEIGNTVYDRVEGYRKDGDPMKVIRNFPKKPKPSSIYEDIGSVSKAYLQSSRSSEASREPRIMYNTPFHGSMTIEVEHEPTDEEISTDSDQFEPDTLDRKPKKFNNTPKLSSVDRVQDIPNNQRNINDWPNRQNRPNEYIINRGKPISNKELVDSNLSSLPDMSYFNNNNDKQVVLRSSGSFKSNSLGNYLSEIGALMNNNDLEKSFSSLREIYEAKNQKNLKQRPGLHEGEHDGRILTLEARHSKRQRETTLDKNMKKILPPDIIPTDASNIYEIPANLTVTNHKNNVKNAQKFFTPSPIDELANNNMKKSNYDVVECAKDKKKQPNMHGIEDEMNLISESLSSSSNSESTDITGISDTQPHSNQNSLKQAYSQVRKTPKCTGVYNLEARRASELQTNPKYMNLSDVHSLRAEQQQQQQQSDCNSDTSTLKTGSTKFYYKSNLNQEANLNNHFGASEDLDKIEIISSKSLRMKDIDLSTEIIDNTKHLISELANDTSTFNPQLNQMPPTKVFHVDISPTNGMQIALGIRDRVKKSKDLKHAWKKFVNMATSKFQAGPNSPGSLKPEIRGEYDLVEKTASFSDPADKDDGIASMSTCDDNSITTASSETKQSIEILSRTPSSSSSSDMKPSRNEMDYGYISADSNELRVQKKNMYTRFNFKMDKHSIGEPSTSKAAQSTDKDWRNRYLHRMQDIKENSESDRNSVSSSKHGSKPTTHRTITKPMISGPINASVSTAHLIEFIPKMGPPPPPPPPKVTTATTSMAANKEDTIQVHVYSSSEEDRYSSGMSSESDGDYNADELCESGAESIETHSVLFKNIRKLNENN